MAMPRSDLAVENSDGELIVLDKIAGEVHQLNRAASLIWQCLSEGLGADEIAVKFTTAFEVDLETAMADVQSTVAQFIDLGLLED